jgi:phosphoribosylaminoimidazole (AIR) synthetase
MKIICSNGLTLARKVLNVKENVHKFYDELGRTLGEELLEPSSIYIEEIMQMIYEHIDLKVVAHVTSHGLNNLRRIGKNFVPVKTLRKAIILTSHYSTPTSDRVEVSKLFNVSDLDGELCTKIYDSPSVVVPVKRACQYPLKYS